MTFENGNITGDLTINDPKLSLTLNDNFNVEGQTNIENVAANTFLNKGEINSLFITDNDGARIVNEGTINGDIEIDANNPVADIKLAGSMSENSLKITGNSVRVIIEKETIINNITVEADNTKIIIDTESDKINTVNVIAVDVEFEISQDFEENKIEGNETTVITKIENMISGYVNYAASLDDIKVGLITNESLDNVNTFNDLEFVVGPEAVDAGGYYRFINLDTEIEFYVVTYKDLNNNGKLDFFDSVDGISGLEMLVNRALKITELGGEAKNRYVFWDVDPGEYIIFAYIEGNEIGFYGNHLKGVSYIDLSEPLTEMDIDISDKYLRVAVGSTDVINETETALYDAEVNLCSSAGDILIEVDNLIEDNEGYAVNLLTGLETGEFYESDSNYIGYLEANDSFSLDFSLSSFKYYLTMEDNGQVEEIFIAGIKGVEAGKYEVYLEEESKLEVLIKEQMLTFIN